MMAIQIPPLRGFISCFIGVSEAEVAAQHEAVSIRLIIISGPDSSTQLQSWHSSVSGWFGVAVAVFLCPQYTHTGLNWDPPGVWHILHPLTPLPVSSTPSSTCHSVVP